MITFIIDYEGEKNVLEEEKMKIIDGAGKGTLDYVSGVELKEFVDETDRLGHSNYFISIMIDEEEEVELFDYRDFDIDDNNLMSTGNFCFIKYDYETVSLNDFLRFIKQNCVYHFKSDIKQIVKPFDYIKEYLPDNFEDLSSEELNNLNIPSYEDLNIYKLPSYDKIDNSYIMRLFVKCNVEDKEIRKKLFYALKNYDL